MLTKYRDIVKKHPKKFQLGLSPYIPNIPTGKQAAFLMLDQYREAFYGGAAGGGKSDALLMAGLRHVTNPFYDGIIFRKTLADLRLADSLITRSHEWLTDTDATWKAQENKWVFPSGATLSFGYLDTEMHKYRYASAAYSYIAFDEVTHMYEDDYTYLFSRLRRKVCTVHKLDGNGKPNFFPEICEECALKSSLPLRMRAASNPGGIGHSWIKKRFAIKKVNEIYRGTNPDKPYIPAFLKDNPYLDQEGYTQSLSQMSDPVTRRQLLAGDWGVSAEGRIKREWIKRYSIRGDYIVRGEQGRGEPIHRKECFIFQTIDPAASVREGPGDEQIWRKTPSWTVIGTWMLDTLTGDLFLWHIERFQKEVPEAVKVIRENFGRHHKEGNTPMKIGIEVDGLGRAVFQIMSRTGLPVAALRTGGQDKLVRVTDFCVRAEHGNVFFPESAPWLTDFEDEIYTWTGHPKEPDDQVDVCGHAGRVATQWATEYLPRDESTTIDIPSAFD